MCNFFYQILNLNKKKVAAIGTSGIRTKFKNMSLPNTTIDPLKLAGYLKNLSKRKINNVILEASSHGLKQNRLDGLRFDKGIFTNLSHDHLDYHKNFNDYLNSKLYLFKRLLKKNSIIITDQDIPEYKKIKKISEIKKFKLRTISNNSQINILEHKYIGEKQFLKIKYKKSKYSFNLNLIGKIQIKNLLMSILAAENKNLKINNIIKVLHKIKPIYGRLEKVGKLKNNAICILDYAHTPKALEISLKKLKEQFNDKKIMLVIGCGEIESFKRLLLEKLINTVIEFI